MRMGYLGYADKNIDLGLERFFGMARESGFQVEIPQFGQSIESARRAFEWGYDLVESADVIILRGSGQTYLQEDHVIQRVIERANNDLSLLVFPGTGSEITPWWNRFLSKFDIYLPAIRLLDKREKSLNATFCESYESFRYPPLFTKVDRVEASDPFAVWYMGESYPVLVADENFQPVDWDTDLPREMNKREMASICVRPAPSGSSVYVFGFEALTDDANGHFACNLLRSLRGPGPQPLAEQLLKQIEINLYEFVSRTLELGDENWWQNLVPEVIRNKCMERRQAERSQDSPQAYLDLIDYKKITSKNWQVFENHFQAVVGEGGKNKLLKWFDRLKDLRKLSAHVTKQHATGRSFTAQDEQFVGEIDLLVRRLFRRVCPLVDWGTRE